MQSLSLFLFRLRNNDAISSHYVFSLIKGDDVLFSDGTKGKIVKMGWMETMVRSSDELVVGIPNTQVRSMFSSGLLFTSAKPN